ncbi:MAG TPA: chemotaxis protein CheW [Gammaproteobacteria bacterium]|nr:chemotaxis protein CheW [Gammaproteobacteria bacterium]
MITEKNVRLPCLLLPVLAQTLLVPTSSVAEIIPYKESDVEILSDVPAWFLGMLSWRGIQMPIAILEKMEPYLSWDGIVGQQSELHKQCYIAVINRVTKINSNIVVQKFRQYPFFSIIVQGTPKLIRVSHKSLSISDTAKLADPRLIMEVKVEEHVAFVPNLDSVWKIIDTLPARLQWLGKIVQRNGG